MAKVDRIKKNLHLERPAAEILDEMENASAYVSALILRRERLWDSYWADLEHSEVAWRRWEIHAAVTALHAAWEVSGRSRGVDLRIPEILSRAEPLARRHGISPDRWSELVGSASEPLIADGLAELTNTLALGNTRLKVRMSKPIRVRWGPHGVGDSVQLDIDADVPGQDELERRLLDAPREGWVLRSGPYSSADGLHVELGLPTAETSREDALDLVARLLGRGPVGWLQE